MNEIICGNCCKRVWGKCRSFGLSRVGGRERRVADKPVSPLCFSPKGESSVLGLAVRVIRSVRTKN